MTHHSQGRFGSNQTVVALIDDNQQSATVLSSALSVQGYDVLVADNGPEGIAKVFLSRPDLILLDVEMPIMDGYQVARRLDAMEETRQIPIIYISGHQAQWSRVKSIQSRAVDYIQKPFALEEIVSRMENQLCMSRLQHELRDANQRLHALNEQLSVNVHDRTVELEQLNAALECFVPSESLEFLGKRNLAQIQRGDHIECDMTILFADIRSFTRRSETMTPQANFDFINAYLDSVSPPITRHEGFIDKYLGDGFLALFPRTASDAVRAAMEMMDGLARFNADWMRPEEPPVEIGIGIHSGNVMFGTVGHSRRLDVTVISDVVNHAQRLQELTKAFQIPVLASCETVSRLDADLAARSADLGCVEMEGSGKRIQVCGIYPTQPVMGLAPENGLRAA